MRGLREDTLKDWLKRDVKGQNRMTKLYETIQEEKNRERQLRRELNYIPNRN